MRRGKKTRIFPPHPVSYTHLDVYKRQGHISTHLVGVVGHIRDRHIRILRGFFGVSSRGLYKACGEPRDRFHVLVGGHSPAVLYALAAYRWIILR